ncbi:MAG: bifunctional homocysteine S-methyltransferase/methylenetetrahydrofolate reductase [Lentisphaeria bacterium]|nr:bifunctional homocysteine S-methyltransferase/methylenetetrahydrofolate reductase [Lentisphaeria bacterium]
MANKLHERLTGRTIIFDGAVGTELYKKNFFLNTSYESICLNSPKIVREIHESYRDAGAEVLTTNSYGANFLQLNKFLLGDKVAEINRAAVTLAREVAGNDLLVAASVGPVDDSPVAGAAHDPVAVLKEQVAALVSAGPDFIQFETMRGSEDLRRVLAVMRDFPDVPYVTSFAVDRDCISRTGDTPARLLTLIDGEEHQPEAFGLNCGIGPESMLNALEILMKQCRLPVIARPNAGMPKSVDNRIFYMCSPEYFTTYAMRFVSLGVRGVGGCCGTGPDHIRDMARSVSPLSRSQETSKVLFVKEAEVPEQPVVPLAERSALAAKLAAGKWVQTVEVVPPQGYDLASTVEKAKLCRESGFDAVNLPDGPRASARIASLVAACRIQADAGIETVLHVCCRDRNLIGIQAELLGCAAMDVRNLLFITGDPPKLGDYPFASGVFDMDSIGLIKLQCRLNRGIDLAGKSIGKPACGVIGSGADPNSIDMEREIRRTQEKIDAGAEFIVTQPVFDVEPLLRFMDAVPGLSKVPLIAGIWPLASYRNAEFMRNEVPGVIVPDRVMERMARGSTKEEQRAEGIQIAREAVAAIRDRVAGVQVSAPFGNVKTAAAVVA